MNPPAAPPKAELKKLKPLARYLRAYRLRIALAGLAILFTSSAVLGMGAGLRYLVDKGLGQSDAHLLNRAYLLLLGVIALLSLATYARYLLVSWLGERVVADIRRDIFRQLLRMDIGFFDTARTGDLLSRLTADTTLLQTVIGSSVSIALRNALLLAGGLAMLLFTNAALTGYVCVMVPIVVAPILFLGRRVRGLSREAQGKVGALNAQAEEALGGIRTVQALTMEAFQTQLFGARVADAMETALARIRLRAFLTALVIALVFGAVVTVLWIGGQGVMSGSLSTGDLSAFVFYSVVVAGSVAALSEVVADLQRAAGAAERLSELLALEPQVRTPAIPAFLPDGASVTFESVSFHYASRPQSPALQHINLTVTPGEAVALVGPSGAGKTTLFQLLLRFYDPQAGRILLGGADIRTLDLAEYRRHIGLVPQEPVLFSADAMTNIRAARPEASDAEVTDAARAAYALEFLEKLPQGMHTPLGEKGVQLSGGQRQRLAIARALVRNPRLLLLDEATSALDAESEQLVREAMGVLMKGRTTLVIAHRLSTVVNADRIVLLREGRVEATGTHAQLMADSPLYARLARLQFDQQKEMDRV